MKIATIRELRNNLGKILSVVEHGESVQILRKNIPIARLIPYKSEEKKTEPY